MTVKEVLSYIKKEQAYPEEESGADPESVVASILARVYNIPEETFLRTARTENYDGHGNLLYDVVLQYFVSGGTLRTNASVSPNFLMTNIQSNLRASPASGQEGIWRIGGALTGLTHEKAAYVASLLDRRRIKFPGKMAILRDTFKKIGTSTPWMVLVEGPDPQEARRKKVDERSEKI